MKYRHKGACGEEIKPTNFTKMFKWMSEIVRWYGQVMQLKRSKLLVCMWRTLGNWLCSCLCSRYQEMVVVARLVPGLSWDTGSWHTQSIELCWCAALQTLVCKQAQLVRNSLWIAEPVQRVMHHYWNCSTVRQPAYEMGSHPHNRLQHRQLNGTETSKQSVAVV